MSIHDGHRQRMKDRFREEGLDHFSEIQVLELLLFYCIPRIDTNEIAHEMLECYGNIAGVLDAPVDELIKFKGIETVEQAETLRNCYLEIDREDAVPLEEGTYYIVDLLESEVFTDEGEHLGKLEDIYNTGAKDIYVVKNELGKTVLLPGIPEVIKEVNLEEKRIIVHLLKGLV